MGLGTAISGIPQGCILLPTPLEEQVQGTGRRQVSVPESYHGAPLCLSDKELASSAFSFYYSLSMKQSQKLLTSRGSLPHPGVKPGPSTWISAPPPNTNDTSWLSKAGQVTGSSTIIQNTPTHVLTRYFSFFIWGGTEFNDNKTHVTR